MVATFTSSHVIDERAERVHIKTKDYLTMRQQKEAATVITEGSSY